jgi:RND family efflux transporter MFP subunit
MVVTLAREGGRDAVFDVPERLLATAPPDPVVAVRLASDASVRAEGRVREISPQADPVTRTFRVRVGLIDPPAGLRLGSTVTGEIALGAPAGIELPASALVEREGGPAVFVFDEEKGSVALRPVTVSRFDLASVLLEDGIAEGEAVVTAGVQALRPGQRVRLAEGAR